MTEYRMLEEGEVIREGDDYLSRFSGKWRASASKGLVVDDYSKGYYRRPTKEKKGTGMFVEEVKTKKIKTVINGKLSNAASVSLKGPDGDGDIQLVVGANLEYGGACYFNKESLKELIENLTEVHELMED